MITLLPMVAVISPTTVSTAAWGDNSPLHAAVRPFQTRLSYCPKSVLLGKEMACFSSAVASAVQRSSAYCKTLVWALVMPRWAEAMAWSVFSLGSETMVMSRAAISSSSSLACLEIR